MRGRKATSLILTISLMLVLGATGPARAESVTGELTIESAFALASDQIAGRFDVFLVLNNMRSSDVTLTAVASPVAGAAVFHKGSEKPFAAGVVIPIHSELYMLPGGVHIALLDVRDMRENTVPIDLEVDGVRTRIDVQLVKSLDDIPDHALSHSDELPKDISNN